MTVYLYVILDVYPFLTKYPFSMAVCVAPMARALMFICFLYLPCPIVLSIDHILC